MRGQRRRPCRQSESPKGWKRLNSLWYLYDLRSENSYIIWN